MKLYVYMMLLVVNPDRRFYQVMGGMVLETNIVSILQAVQDQDKLHKESMRTSTLTKPDANSVQQRIGAGSDMSKWQYNW